MTLIRGETAEINLLHGLFLNILLIFFVVSLASSGHLDQQQYYITPMSSSSCLSGTRCDQFNQHNSTSKHFVLIHGSCLGAWSWYKLLPLLKSSGHNVTAIDLAASGINPVKPNDLHTISEYFQPLINLMSSLPSCSKVILVGHSLGGLAISYAMQHFPEKISVGVFVTAQMPGPTLNVSTLYQELLKASGPGLDNKYTYDNGPNNPPTTFLFGTNFLSQKVYDLSPPEDIDLATTMIRPLPLFSFQDMSNVIVLSNEKYGSVPRVYIISEEDKITDKQVEKWMITNNPPNRVETIRGSDHMVMVSQPLQLLNRLQNIATDFQ